MRLSLGVGICLCPPTTTMRLVSLAALLLAAPVFAQSQTVLYPGQTGEPLLSAIDADYSPALTLGYNPARDSLYAYEQRTDGELCGVYTRFCIQLAPGADPSTDAFNKGINAEHTWPQSMGAAAEPSRSDLHHLFPAKANVNSSRGNEPYGEIPDADTNRWFRGASDQTTIPSVFLDEWSERGTGRFEPREDHKGNAARAVFYYRAIYPGQVAAYNSQSFFDTQADDLMDWHTLDPVDLEEYARSAWIATLQGTPNPFVLDSTLARRAYTLMAGRSGGGGGSATGPFWVNELHYDNVGKDKWEGVELAGPAGTSLSGWSLVLYNGSNGTQYKTVALSGTIPAQQAGFGTVLKAVPGIQNGGPDGFALVAPDGTVAEFLSYEGGFVATDGPAAGSGVCRHRGGRDGLDAPSDTACSESGRARPGTTSRGRMPTIGSPAQPNVGQTFVSTALAWVNELHYDNSGADQNEGVEIAGTAGLDLAGWSLEFVNGANGSVYATVPLSGTIDDEGFGMGALWFSQAGIQNGSPDGVALLDDTGAVVQFLSYEGVVTATDGTASGMASTDIGVTETGSTSADHSLQLTGTGSSYGDFAWSGPSPHSRGMLNTMQSSVMATAVDDRPSDSVLDVQLYPNPAHSRTTLALDLRQAAEVRADVFDALGRHVLTLDAGRLGAGFQSLPVDLSGAPAGLYIVRIQAGVEVASRTLTLVR